MKTPLFGDLTAALPDATATEAFETLTECAGTRFERIVSRGQASPPGFWYEPDCHEFVLVCQGWGELEFDDGTRRRLAAGEWALVPASCRHRVTATDPDHDTIWLAVHWPLAN